MNLIFFSIVDFFLFDATLPIGQSGPDQNHLLASACKIKNISAGAMSPLNLYLLTTTVPYFVSFYPAVSLDLFIFSGTDVDPENVRIYFGEHNTHDQQVEESQFVLTPAEIINHPDYDGKLNDIQDTVA